MVGWLTVAHGGNGKGGGVSTEMWFGNAPIGVKKISTLLGVDKCPHHAIMNYNIICILL